MTNLKISVSQFVVQISLTRPNLYFLRIVEFSHYNEYGVLHVRNVDGYFRFEIRNESSEIEGLCEIHYNDEGAIMGDDEQELNEGDLDNDNDLGI